MASLRNEIVKFIADIQLDPQQAAAYQKNLADCERSADALRKSIAETTAKMDQMRSSGQESTQAYQALKKSLDADTKALKEATKGADKYAEALGINSMSLSQLQRHAKQVRTALANTHKEANPKVWSKYNDELCKTEARIREIKAGGEKAGTAMKGLGASIAGGFTVGSLAVKAFDSVVGIAKKGFETFIGATQTWGDRWAVATSMVNAGWRQLIANIGQGSNVTKASVMEAMQAAKEAAELLDELFERTNSYKLMETEARAYINTQREIANNSANDPKTRLAALDAVRDKELELAKIRQDIAQQELDAYQGTLMTQMQLNDQEELKSFIQEYEQNRELYKQAAEYNKLLEEQSRLKSKTNPFVGALAADQLYDQDIKKNEAELAKYDEKIKEAARLLRQYNLSNDEFVSNYVDALLKVKKAEEEITAIGASQAEKRGTLEKQIQAEEKAAQNEAYQSKINAAQSAYDKQILALKQYLEQGLITEAEYSYKSQTAEIAMLNAKIAINQAYGRDITDLQTKIVDIQLSIQRTLSQALEADSAKLSDLLIKTAEETADTVESIISEVLEMVNDDLAESDAELARLVQMAGQIKSGTRNGQLGSARSKYESDLEDLKSLHDLQLITEEEYLQKKKQLHEEYNKTIAEITLKTWRDSMNVASQFIDASGNMVNALRDAESSKLDAQMQAELTAAGDNAQERERIEKEFEQKKLDLQKKYADVDMAIQISKTIAAGALAVMQAFAQLGPIAGAVMAGIIAATTAAEVASIVQQRNAIKNSSVSSSGNSSSDSGATVKTREVTGYADGGYTGDGGRYEAAGIVHRGEYVVAAPELRDPAVAREIARIERKRLSRVAGHSRLPGYADGGYTGSLPSSLMSDDILKQIYVLVRDYCSQTPRAYVVLSDIEAKMDYNNRIKKKMSMR